jgi:myo-inositol 2-dehydrogenase / D-chiro-inositol 1-dehydrogenase
MNTVKNNAFLTDRRNFLKNSSILAGGLFLGDLSSPKLFLAGKSTIKIALIGCGGRGTGAAVQALSTQFDVRLVAMADIFRDAIDSSYEALYAKFGKAKIDVPQNRKFVGFEAYKEAIAAADVVLLTTSPGFRPIHFEEAVKQNKQIFMEKPVATDAPGVRKVLATAEEAKRKKLNVVVGLQRHYQQCYIETIKRIHGGDIGDIVSGQVYWNSGGVWVKPRKPGQTELEYQMRNWYYFTWLCGDFINEQNVHNIDVANWVKNAYPVSAQGTGSRFLRTGKDSGEIYDNHTVEFIYADGAVIQSQCRHFPGALSRVDESFQGTKGKAYMAGNRMDSGKLWNQSGKTIYDHNGKDNPNAYQVEHDELFAAVNAGQYKYADAERGAKSTMTAIMGRFATYSGNEIKWDEALNSQITQMPEKIDWNFISKVVPDANGKYPFAIPGKTKVI